jgi:hypothetical protein
MIDLTGSDDIETGYDVIPEGEYNALVEKLEWKDNYEKTHKVLSYQVRITGPTYKNRVLFAQYDLNTKDEALRLKAINRVKRMAAAFSIPTNDNKLDEASFVNKQCNIQVSTYKTKEGVEKNSIYYFKPYKLIEAKKKEGYLGGSHSPQSSAGYEGDSIPF